MRKICVVVGSRANYSSIKSVLQAIDEHADLQLQVVAGASALLDRFGEVIDVIEADGFTVDARVHMLIEGETPSTMAQSTGLGLMHLPVVFDMLRPDFVVTVGDRFETMATAVAAAYMNIRLAHTMGGEVTGTIDESVRHAVTKLAHVHFPATPQAAERIVRMGEDPEHVHLVGCPRMDLVARVLQRPSSVPGVDELEAEGVGGHVDPAKPYLLVANHPVTTEYGLGEQQIRELMAALRQLAMPTIMLWPNADAGSEDVARGMRKFRERHVAEHIRFYKNFPVETFIRLAARAACMVGNSSAAIREGALLGVPAVNLGIRQAGRERGPNVLDCGYQRDAIEAAVRRQAAHGPFPSVAIYGDGTAGKRIADVLANKEVAIQKRITY